MPRKAINHANRAETASIWICKESSEVPSDNIRRRFVHPAHPLPLLNGNNMKKDADCILENEYATSVDQAVIVGAVSKDGSLECTAVFRRRIAPAGLEREGRNERRKMHKTTTKIAPV